MAIGSGGASALSAARALLAHTELSAVDICQEAMTIARRCVFILTVRLLLRNYELLISKDYLRNRGRTNSLCNS